MSTVKATNFSHPSAASPAIVLDAAGGATVAGMGLVLVSPTSIANSGGSASASGGAVTFTGVSSVSLNGVFTSAYDNYRTIIQATGSGVNNLQFRYRAAGSDSTGATYVSRFCQLAGTYAGFSFTTSAGYITTVSTVPTCAFMDLSGVRSSTQKTTNSVTFNNGTIDLSSCGNTVTTIFDGITILPDAGTISGTIRVYGYKNS